MGGRTASVFTRIYRGCLVDRWDEGVFGRVCVVEGWELFVFM